MNVQHRYAIERAIRFLEIHADGIDKANPGDPYASLMVREDVETLQDCLRTAPWTNTRVHVMGPKKRKPRAGDRRVTKKHGEQVRVQVTHNGAHVVTRHGPVFEWVAPDDPRAARYVRPA
jgi:hypothetical protein